MTGLLPSVLLAALTLVAPPDGATVPTLRDGQKAYLARPRTTRLKAMDDQTVRGRLLRVGGTQQPVRLAWSGATNAVYTLTVSHDGGTPQTFALTNRTDAYLTNLDLGTTYRWSVATDGEPAVSATFVTEDLPPRNLRADGVLNFRDLGGWRTTDGRRVKANRIFRSAGLRDSSNVTGRLFRQKVEPGERRVTAAGIATLRDEFGIRTDLDIRSERETLGMTASVLGADVQWRCIPFVAYNFIDDPVRGREAFARIFRIFTQKDNYPILMHCSGGRDRTGTVAFLLNGLLGVSQDDLCRDWEFSVFSSRSESFAADLIDRLDDYLHTLPGQTLREHIESYAKSCGITDEEIATFRALMLTPAAGEGR